MIPNRFLRRLLKGIADWITPLPPKLEYPRWKLKNRLLRLSGLNIATTGVAIGAGFQCIDGQEETIKIDSYVSIGHNVKLWNFDEIHIEKFSMIAAGVTITNGWHNKSTLEPISGLISIGPGCWIGANATIIGSVNVGANSIIAAGALVNKDVLPNSIVAGVPAKVIGTRELPDRVWHLNNIYFCPNEFEIKSGVVND
jgi:acetyltransferase-like isoleucine patch superfamily enzyme